ncbi:MAG TPA: adenylate/guanylate cyclase domain-containing protein [Spirochaetia bacterium]|nr:adenylate/guanylate cyclase domain-containing protein [Spirochaetia bacterium]
MKTKALARAIERYQEEYHDVSPLVREIGGWTAAAGDSQLWRINPFALAEELGVERKPLLEGFLTLASQGFFDLNWDFHCTECNAVAGTHRHLRDATASNHCPLCDVDFRNDLIHNVEVTFTPSASYYTVSKRFIDAQTAQTVALHKSKEIRLPRVYVRGIDCLHVALFRELFESETLSLRESMRIGQVCIMFTDIKGSTALYDRLGDSAAYGLVRVHFEILFEKIAVFDGVIVKTIGDSVMASFRHPSDGVGAALAIQRSFTELNERKTLRNEILVKIGLHSGATIMVNLNNRIDYFGQSVNMAARIQNSAEGGEVVISETVRRDSASIAALRGQVSSLTKREVALKGISESQSIYRLNFAIPISGRGRTSVGGVRQTVAAGQHQ